MKLRLVSIPDSHFQLLRGRGLVEESGIGRGVKVKRCKQCNTKLYFKSSGSPQWTYLLLSRLPEEEQARAALSFVVTPGMPRFEETDLPLDALHTAASEGEWKRIKELLQLGFPVNGEIDGRTPLDHASSPRVAKILLDHGADTKKIPALEWRSRETMTRVRLLLKYGCPSQKLFENAVCWSTVKVAHYLLHAGADINALDDLHEATALHLACHNSPAMVRLILKHGPDFSRLSSGGGHALGYCALWGYVGLMRVLLRGGFPVNLMEQDPESSALYTACQGGHCRSVELLLNFGADPNLGSGRSTPLMAASQNGSLAIVDVLLRHGADQTRRDRDGDTARDLAARFLPKLLPVARASFVEREGRIRHSWSTNAAGEQTLIVKQNGCSYRWTNCHAAVVERLDRAP